MGEYWGSKNALKKMRDGTREETGAKKSGERRGGCGRAMEMPSLLCSFVERIEEELGLSGPSKKVLTISVP